MKSSIKKNTFKAIYRLLDKVSPVNGDCGLLCGCLLHMTPDPVCCQSATTMTICSASISFPARKNSFRVTRNGCDWSWAYAEDYEFPDSWHGKVYFLECLKHVTATANMRPLQCRTFPLAPHIDEDGELYMIYQNGQLSLTPARSSPKRSP